MRPTTRLAYWTGILRSEFVMNTMNTTINSIPITSRIAVYHLIAPEDSEETSVLMSDGIREMIPANRIIEMPLPMPN